MTIRREKAILSGAGVANLVGLLVSIWGTTAGIMNMLGGLSWPSTQCWSSGAFIFVVDAGDFLKLNGDTLKILESNPKVCGYADIEGAFFGSGRQLTFFIVSTDTSNDSAVFKVSAVEQEFWISSDNDYDKLIAAISQLN